MIDRSTVLGKLIWRMCEAYGAGKITPEKAWVHHRELCQLTPAYSQRFGEWREVGIITEKKPDGQGGFLYRLVTNPSSVDWDQMRLVFRCDDPIKPTHRKDPKKVMAEGLQGRLL